MMTSPTGKRPKSSRRIQGFTVTELIVVMVIMVLLAGLAVPRFVGSLREERLRTAGRSLVSFVQLARSRAVAESTLTRVQFDYDRDLVSMARLVREEGAAAGQERRPSWQTVDDSLARERVLPTGVTLRYVGKEPLGGEARRLEELVFRPDGSADEAYIILDGYEESVLVVEVDEVRFAPRVLDIWTRKDLGKLEALR